MTCGSTSTGSRNTDLVDESAAEMLRSAYV
jgi:hypothetical protein